eukprot:403345810
MVSLISEFKMNVPDLCGLMLLPQILEIIQERLLTDRRLLLVYKIRPKVTITNNLEGPQNHDGYDRFTLAEQFKCFSKQIDDQLMFDIFNKMKYECQFEIIYEFMQALDGISITHSMIEFSRSIDKYLDLALIVFQKSHKVKIATSTYEMLNYQRRGFLITSTQQLEIENSDNHYFVFTQLLKQFPLLQQLTLDLLEFEQSTLFSQFKDLFRIPTPMQLQFFKAHIIILAFCDSDQFLHDFFQLIADIEIPTIILKMEFHCKREILKPESEIYGIFENYEVSRKYGGFQNRILGKFHLKLNFKKQIVNDVNRHKYTFDLNFKNREPWWYNDQYDDFSEGSEDQ